MRYLWIPLLAASSLFADTHADIVDLFASSAAGLSEDNPAAFLKAFDKTSPGYEKIAANVTALLSGYEVGSAVEFFKDEGDEDHRLVDADWRLEIQSKVKAGQFERRELVLKCRVERRKSQWKIVAVDPADFFAPPVSETAPKLPSPPASGSPKPAKP